MPTPAGKGLKCRFNPYWLILKKSFSQIPVFWVTSWTVFLENSSIRIWWVFIEFCVISGHELDRKTGKRIHISTKFFVLDEFSSETAWLLQPILQNKTE